MDRVVPAQGVPPLDDGTLQAIVDSCPNLELLIVATPNSAVRAVDARHGRKLRLLKICACEGCHDSLVRAVNVSCCPELRELDVRDSPNMARLEMFGCSKLEAFRLFGGGSISALDFTGCISLKTAQLKGCGSITTLDLSRCTSPESVEIEDCLAMTVLNLKNLPGLDRLRLRNCPNLQKVLMPRRNVDLRGVVLPHRILDYS
jgi:hypothetical protein